MSRVRLLPDDVHNRELVANVHPADWVNPTPASRYHLVVIGAGTAGLVTAAGAAILGARVALVERNLMGGDCLNFGCVPSKALIGSARAAQRGDEASFGAVMERLRRLRARISHHDSVTRFSGLGVDVFLGSGRFTGPDTVDVDGTTLCFKKAVVATGGGPFVPPIEGLAEAGYLTNETVFTLTERPRRFLVLGGGPIGCELAQAFQRLGSRVTLVEMEPRLLPREDPDASALVDASLRADGVDVRTGFKAARVAGGPDGKTVLVESDGTSQEVEVDEILAAIGRKANVAGLGLDVVGVDHHPLRGIAVNDRLQTSNPRVYAAGDVSLPLQFTHTADAAARIVLQNSLFPGRAKFSALTVPWCTYTDPEVAHVGMTPAQAGERGIDLDTIRVEMKDVDRAILEGEDEGFVKIHVRRGTDRILGATIVARHAGDMISEITVAMTAGTGLGTIGRTIHPYPTRNEAIRKAADDLSRRRLTPFVRKLLGLWLRLTG